MAPLLISTNSYDSTPSIFTILIPTFASMVLFMLGIFMCGCCSNGDPKRKHPMAEEKIESIHESALPAPIEQLLPPITPDPIPPTKTPSPPASVKSIPKTDAPVDASVLIDQAKSLNLMSTKPDQSVGVGGRMTPKDPKKDVNPSLKLMGDKSMVNRKIETTASSSRESSVIGGKPNPPGPISTKSSGKDTPPGVKSGKDTPPQAAPTSASAGAKSGKNAPPAARDHSKISTKQGKSTLTGESLRSRTNVSMSSFTGGDLKPAAKENTASLDTTSGSDQTGVASDKAPAPPIKAAVKGVKGVKGAKTPAKKEEKGKK